MCKFAAEVSFLIILFIQQFCYKYSETTIDQHNYIYFLLKNVTHFSLSDKILYIKHCLQTIELKLRKTVSVYKLIQVL